MFCDAALTSFPHRLSHMQCVTIDGDRPGSRQRVCGDAAFVIDKDPRLGQLNMLIVLPISIKARNSRSSFSALSDSILGPVPGSIICRSFGQTVRQRDRRGVGSVPFPKAQASGSIRRCASVVQNGHASAAETATVDGHYIVRPVLRAALLLRFFRRNSSSVPQSAFRPWRGHCPCGLRSCVPRPCFFSAVRPQPSCQMFFRRSLFLLRATTCGWPRCSVGSVRGD